MSWILSPFVRALRPGWAAAFFLVTACGGRTAHPGAGTSGGTGASGDGDAASPGWSQQLGVYGSCAYSELGVASGTGGEITLTQTSSGALEVVFTNDAGAPATFSLTFRPTSDTSAALEPAGQPMPWEGFCWSGPPLTDSGLPIDPAPTAMTLGVTSGALTYDADTLYVSVVGTPEVDAECEVQKAGTITCSRSGGPSTASEPDASTAFPTGVYACSSSLSASGDFQGTSFESVAGGNGTLTLTQSGAVVTAAYSGDTFVEGSLRFAVTTGASAVPAAPGQTMTVDCFAPVGTAVQQTLAVTSGALTMDGTTVFLSFSGTAEPAAAGAGACDGVKIPVTLTCAAQP